MVLDDDEEANRITHNEMIQSRVSIQNNVINRRREQLKAWEGSEMNRLSSLRKPGDDFKVRFQDSDVFFSACVSGDQEEVAELLAKGANINTGTIDGVTVLHQSVIDGKFEMVTFLVDHGADVNAQDNEGWTPLHAAVCCGNLNMVEYLCDQGSDITVTNTDKELPVDLAEDDQIRNYLDEKLTRKGLTALECREREEKVMLKDCMEWIKAGVYLDKPHPRTGATALHVAASKGYNKLIALLVQAGADVNAKDFEGWTPLHAAAHWGEKEACRILMARGADVNAETITGQNVLRVADSSIVEALERMEQEFKCKPMQIDVDEDVELKSQLEDGSVTVQATVLQSTDNTPHSGRRLSIVRMNSEEKETLKKKDEHDENVSLHFQLPSAASREERAFSPPSVKRVDDQPIGQKSVSEGPVSSIKLAPAVPPKTTILLKPQTSVEDEDEREAEDEEWEAESEATDEAAESESQSTAPVVSTTLYLPKTYQVPGANRLKDELVETQSQGSNQSTPSVQAVLPAPRVQSNTDSSSYSTGTSLSSSVFSSSTASHTSSSTGSAQPPAKPSGYGVRDLTPTPHRKPSSVTSRTVNSPRRHESLDDEEQSAQTVSSASDASNTSASVSSIQTRSRSMTPKETSSSLYSSDQSVRCMMRMPAPQPPTSGAQSTNQPVSASGSSVTQTTPVVTETRQESCGSFKSTWSQLAQQAVRQAPLATISTSPSAESLSSVSEPSVMFRKPAVPPHQFQPSPKKVTSSASSIIQRLNSLTQPTIASATRQRPPMTRSQSVVAEKTAALAPVAALSNPNAPWVSHWKNERGTIQVGSAKNTVSGMIKAHEQSQQLGQVKPIQSSTAFRKYVEQTRSLQQTPPTLPAPQKESEAERKAKSRLQRASRRSTQGVTLEQLSGCASNSSSATSTPSSSRQQNRPEDDEQSRWRGSASIVPNRRLYGVPTSPAPQSRVMASEAASTRAMTPTTKSTVSSGSALSQLNTQTPPTLPGDTPSAAKLRRSQLFRANRRGTGPVDMEVVAQSMCVESAAPQPHHRVSDPPAAPSTPSQTPLSVRWRPTALAILQQQRISPTNCTGNTTDGAINTARIAPFLQRPDQNEDECRPELPTFATTGAIPDRRTNGTSIKNGLDAREQNYKLLYERTRDENERLRKEIEGLRLAKQAAPTAGPPGSTLSGAIRRPVPAATGAGALATSASGSSVSQASLSAALSSEPPTVPPRPGRSDFSSSLSHSSTFSQSGLNASDNDRRQLESRIKELEVELQKFDQLQCDHKRLKNENNALIKVITKLTKEGQSRQPSSSSNTGFTLHTSS